MTDAPSYGNMVTMEYLQAMVAAERARCVALVNFAFNAHGTKGERSLCDNIIAAIQEQLK